MISSFAYNQFSVTWASAERARESQSPGNEIISGHLKLQFSSGLISCIPSPGQSQTWADSLGIGSDSSYKLETSKDIKIFLKTKIICYRIIFLPRRAYSILSKLFIRKKSHRGCVRGACIFIIFYYFLELNIEQKINYKPRKLENANLGPDVVKLYYEDYKKKNININIVNNR